MWELVGEVCREDKVEEPDPPWPTHSCVAELNTGCGLSIWAALAVFNDPCNWERRWCEGLEIGVGDPAWQEWLEALKDQDTLLNPCLGSRLHPVRVTEATGLWSSQTAGSLHPLDPAWQPGLNMLLQEVAPWLLPRTPPGPSRRKLCPLGRKQKSVCLHLAKWAVGLYCLNSPSATQSQHMRNDTGASFLWES